PRTACPPFRRARALGRRRPRRGQRRRDETQGMWILPWAPPWHVPPWLQPTLPPGSVSGVIGELPFSVPSRTPAIEPATISPADARKKKLPFRSVCEYRNVFATGSRMTTSMLVAGVVPVLTTLPAAANFVVAPPAGP